MNVPIFASIKLSVSGKMLMDSSCRAGMQKINELSMRRRILQTCGRCEAEYAFLFD